MSRPRIGEVMVDLGLMSRAQVAEVLEALRTREQGRFGELAVELGLIDEGALAKAVAEQFRLRVVPDDRIARLNVPEAVVKLLPVELLRDHQVVPTFFDADKEVLSLLVADPTDVPALRRAKEASRARMLRLFVGTRTAVAALVERLAPDLREVDAYDISSLKGHSSKAPEPRSTPVVLETRLPLLAALRRVAEIEGAALELVSEPDAVTSLVESGACDRVLMRAEVAPQAEPYLGSWRRSRPGLPVSTVNGFSPSFAPDVSYTQARDFFMGVLEFALLAAEREQVGLRAEMRRTVKLCRGVAAELELPQVHQDAVAIAALFYHVEKLSALSGLKQEGSARTRFSTALGLLSPHRPPFPIEPLFRALEDRMAGRAEVGDHLGAEVLYSVTRALAAGIGGRVDAAEILDGEAGMHDPLLISALSRVLRKEQLRDELSEQGDAAAHHVLIAERDADTVTALEARLRQAGFTVEVCADGEAAMDLIAQRPPDALIANLRLPRRDGLGLTMTLQRDPKTAGLPVLLLTDRAGPADRARGLEVGAVDVLEKPVNAAVLLALLRRSVQPKETQGAAVSGRLSELSMADLIQTLSLGGRTATIQVAGVGEPGAVHLSAGKLVAAKRGTRQGNEALFAMMAMTEGRFAVRFGEPTPPANLKGQTDFLLLEGLRRLDEAKKG